MQLSTLLSVATALVATTYANGYPAPDQVGTARIINRCDYPVYLWSVEKGVGCPLTSAKVLKKGEVYTEKLSKPSDDTGVSIKVSSTSQCTKGSIVQLEYFLSNAVGFAFNFLDVSYVDCENNDCPTKQEGYYLQAGNQNAGYASSAGNTWCPILSCSDPVSCAKMSYILPDDTQTKTCDKSQDLDFYMCGSNAPTDGDSTPSKPSSSYKASTPASSSAAPKPTTLAKVATTPVQKVQAAEITPLAQVKDIPRVKTQVVVVTAYKTINAKRHDHAHAHARRHQPFNA
jgi:hypothetical protein